MRSKVRTANQALELMRRGCILQQTHTRTGLKWFLVPDGGEINPNIAATLVQCRDVRPQADGLFPGVSQSFEIAAGQEER